MELWLYSYMVASFPCHAQLSACNKKLGSPRYELTRILDESLQSKYCIIELLVKAGRGVRVTIVGVNLAIHYGKVGGGTVAPEVTNLG